MKRLALTKDGNLTYCTESEENIEKRRCNHMEHQLYNENVKDFLLRIGKSKSLSVVSQNIPVEIKWLNEGLVLLDKAISDLKLKPITIKAVGGYASYHLTDNATVDIDSIERLDVQIKEIINEIAYQSNGKLEENWLNDEVDRFSQFGNSISKYIINLIKNGETNKYFEENNDNLPSLKNIKLFKAKPEVVLCMKIGAMDGRNKEKDIDDFKKICKAKHWSAHDVWKICQEMKIDQFLDKMDLASTLFTIGAITDEKDYIKFME